MQQRSWCAAACVWKAGAGGVVVREEAARVPPHAAAVASAAAAAHAARASEAAAPAGLVAWWAAWLRGVWLLRFGSCAHERELLLLLHGCCDAVNVKQGRSPPALPPLAPLRCCLQRGCSPPLHLRKHKENMGE
eukprot:scaffold181002_cov18-Tisochrysis_lutea.AAC.1